MQMKMIAKIVPAAFGSVLVPTLVWLEKFNLYLALPSPHFIFQPFPISYVRNVNKHTKVSLCHIKLCHQMMY